jgi:hypothetical protein
VSRDQERVNRNVQALLSRIREARGMTLPDVEDQGYRHDPDANDDTAATARFIVIAARQARGEPPIDDTSTDDANARAARVVNPVDTLDTPVIRKLLAASAALQARGEGGR